MSYDDDEDDEYEDDRCVEVGARVQKTDDVAEPMGGVIESIAPAEQAKAKEYWRCSEEEQNKMYAHATIKWDDGSSTTDRIDHVQVEDTELERSFRKAADTALVRIQKKLAIASKAITEAEEIADQYGIPFSSGVSPLSQSYFPSTTSELYPDLDKEFVESISGAYHSEYGEEGWQHSAVC